MRTDTEENFYEAGNAGLRVRHLETNNGSPSETCNKGFPKKAEAVRHNEQTPEHLSPELILEACPTLSEYPEPIEDLSDLVAAGRYLRASLSANESAWTEAVAEIGLVRAAVTVIYVLQLYDDDVSSGEGRIKNPGGYFRAMARLVKAGTIDLGVELLGLQEIGRQGDLRSGQAGVAVTLPCLADLTERWSSSGEDHTSPLWREAWSAPFEMDRSALRN